MTPNPLLGTSFTLLAYGVGALVFWIEARRRKLNTEGIGWLALLGACGGALCGKLVEALLGSGTVLFGGGRTILGAVAGGWLAVMLAKRALKLQRSTGDLWALALSSGESVGRVGCFFHTCCYGAVCHAPWAVASHGAPRYPAQLFASAWCAVLFVVLWRMRTRVREGALFPLYLLGWGAGRFGLEFLRAHEPNVGPGSAPINGLSLAQWFCLSAMLMGAWMLVKQARRTSAIEVTT